MASGSSNSSSVRNTKWFGSALHVSPDQGTYTLKSQRLWFQTKRQKRPILKSWENVYTILKLIHNRFDDTQFFFWCMRDLELVFSLNDNGVKTSWLPQHILHYFALTIVMICLHFFFCVVFANFCTLSPFKWSR